MTLPRPCPASEAVERALSIVGKGGAYQYGTGDYLPHIAGGELVDLPWTDRERDHAIGSDCAGFAIAWCYKLRRHRPGYCRGAKNFDDVEDDINVNSALEDATSAAPDLFQLATGIPRAGDLLCYPTFRLPTVPLPFIGHVGIVVDASRASSGWDASAPRYDLLDVAQCCGPDGRGPAVIRTDASHWLQWAHTWPKPQHTVYVLRAIA